MKTAITLFQSLRTQNDHSIGVLQQLYVWVVEQLYTVYMPIHHLFTTAQIRGWLQCWVFGPISLQQEYDHPDASRCLHGKQEPLDVRSSAANSLYHRDCCRISEGRVQTGNCSWRERETFLYWKEEFSSRKLSFFQMFNFVQMYIC